MTVSLKKPSVPWPLIVVSFLLTGIMVLIGFYYIKDSKTHLFQQTSDEITLIRDLKTKQIESWRDSKLEFAITIQDNLSLFHQVESFFSEKGDRKDREEIIYWLKSVIGNSDIRSAQLIDSEGNVRLAVPENDTTYGTYRGSLINGQFESRNIFLSDFHFSEGSDFVHLDLLIPFWGKDTGENKAEALLMFRIDPKINLYPLIESWPLPSKSSETLLLRRDGDTIVYLSNVRHLGNSALKLKLPVTIKDFIGAKASVGFEGAIHGVDYRNVIVIAATKRIKNTEWFIVSKTDREEIAAKYKDQIFLNRVISVLFIALVLSVIASIIWTRRVKFYREKYESEIEKQALKKHYDYILKYANDIIFLIDNDRIIVEANDKAIEVYKYSREELIGAKMMILRLPEMASQLEDQTKILNDIGYTRYETIHKCKDGETFPIEISARLVEIEGAKYYQSIGRDITERKKAETLLIEREFFLSESQRIGKIGSYVYDIKSDSWTSSEVLDKIFGINEDYQKTLESWNLLIHPDQRKEMSNYFINHVVGEKKNFDLEYRIIKHDSGEECWVLGRGELSFSPEGEPIRMIGVIQDISESKKAEILLYETEQTYTGLVNTITEAIYVHKDDGVFLDVNEGAVKMYGYSREELIGKTPLFVSAPGKNNMEDIGFIIRRVFLTGKKEQFEFWGKRKNGEVFLKDVVSNKGKYFGEDVVISTARDITDRKLVEDELKESRERLLSIFRVAPTGIGVVRERVLWDVNPRICEMTGYEPSELNGRNSRILYPTQEEFDYVGREKYEQIAKFGTGMVETRWKRKDGSIIDILLSSTPLIPDDLSHGVTFTALDITDRKRAEREVIIAKEKAEESDRLKTAFLHNISHEIRTPMNAIVGFTALLDDQNLRNEDRKQFIDIIYQSSNQLLSIITDIVDISNIETGQIKVTLSPVNINTILRNLFEQYNIGAKGGVIVSIKLPLADESAILETDGTKLIQILSNLLNNSLKFTKEGRIEFGYTIKGEYIEFFVKDTGIGIPADQQSKIFDRFYQVENSSSRTYGGTGLGLSICSGYAELLGGNLRVESEPGEGSTFYFTIPYSIKK